MQLHVVKPAPRQAKRTAVRKTPPGARPSKHPITQAPAETSVVAPTTRIKPTTAPSTPAESRSKPLDLTVVAPPQRSDNASQFGKPAQPNTMYLHRPLLKPQRKIANLPKSIWRPTRVVSVDSYYSSDGTPESVTVMDNGDIIVCKRQRYLFDKALDGAQLGLCFTVQDQW